MLSRRIYRALDTRLGTTSAGRITLAKVFPDHWSFMLGEVALYAFLALLLTGTYLTLFFEPSTSETVYDGAYGPLRGSEISSAFASTVSLSFDVRAGLLICARLVSHALLVAVDVLLAVVARLALRRSVLSRSVVPGWAVGHLETSLSQAPEVSLSDRR